MDNPKLKRVQHALRTVRKYYPKFKLAFDETEYDIIAYHLGYGKYYLRFYVGNDPDINYQQVLLTEKNV